MNTKERYLMSSIFDSTGKFQLGESLTDKETDPRVDGENIIGSVEGVFFVPDGFSRNHRFYPCELWQKQLSDEDITRRLTNSIMFGCIGHSTGPVTEQDLSDGKVSHIMDKLWIDENTGMGMGKAYILNTPAGRNLKTYLKAGSNLKVSSRGEGSFAEGVEKDGHPVVEASSYNLITFDFVIEPGFTETNPQIMEGYIEEVLINNKEETQVIEDEQKGKEDSMDKLLEQLTAEKEKAVNELSESKLKHSEEIAKLEEKITSLTEQCNSSASKLKLKSSVSKARIKKLQGVVESYSALGSVEDIKKASLISKAAIQELKSYKSLGKISEIKEALKSLVKVSESLKAYKELGTVESIKELLAMSERFVTLQHKQKVMDEAKNLSTESGKAIEEVAKMIEETGVEETRKALQESKVEEETKTEKIDVLLETDKQSETLTEKQPPSLVEVLFEESCSKMFIQEDEEDEEKPEDEEVNDEEITDEDKPEDEESAEGEEEKTEEERLEDVEDQLDSVQSQIDALTASFDKILGDAEPELDDESEEEFDFEIE